MNSIQITSKGVLISFDILKSTVAEPILKKILSSLTIKSKIVGRQTSQYTAPITKKAYIIKTFNTIKYLIIPKTAIIKFLPYINNVQNMLPMVRKINSANLEPSAERSLLLYEYQAAAVNYLSTTDKNYVYLQMDTGLGKSRVGCALIAHREEPAIVIVPTQAIAEQWFDEFTEMYPKLNVIIYSNLKHAVKIDKTNLNKLNTEINTNTEMNTITEINKPKKIKPKKIHIPASSETHDVFIMIINTFREKDYTFVEGFGTIVLDEAHEYHSECNSQALWLSQSNFVLGLSATPDERPDELDKYIQLHLGPILYPSSIPGFDISSINFKAQVKVIEYEGNDKYCEAILTPAGTISAIMTITNIIGDPYRLKLIVQEIQKLNTIHLLPEGEAQGLSKDLSKNKRHGIFVFAERRDFLITLKNALIAMGETNILIPELNETIHDETIHDETIHDETIYDETIHDETINDETIHDETIHDETIISNPQLISVLRGGISKNTLIETRKAKAHIVLTTYGYSRRGISLPEMTSLVLVTPRRNGMRQIIGRILRRGSDETIIRQIVDIVDVCTVLKGQFAERKKIYKGRKYPLTKIVTKWDEYI